MRGRGRSKVCCWLGRVLQVDYCETSGDVEAELAFDADGLKRNRAGRAADQCVGANPGTDGCTGGYSAVATRERTWSRIGGRRNYRPDDLAASEIADIDPNFGNVASIMLDSGRPRIGAVEGT